MNEIICTNCVMDTSDINIQFDQNGVCNHCNSFQDTLVKLDNYKKIGLDSIIHDVTNYSKKNNSKYDCIIGISGGVDSSYVAYLAKNYDLNALLVHLDNGWNSELSIKNIENIVDYTGYDLYTHVINWKEFKDIQRSFFDANVVDLELISDHAIFSTVYKLARKNKVKFILSGENLATEAIMPSSWNWQKSDSKNIKSIHRKFGMIKLKSFPFMSGYRKLFYNKIGIVKSIPILNYINFDKEQAKKIIKKEMNWIDYGGKHHESIFTRFYQTYILPNKFGIDKRKAHLSTLINMNQLSRSDALKFLSQPSCDPKIIASDEKLLLKKLGFQKNYFLEYMNNKPVSHLVYGSEVSTYNLILNIYNKIR